MPALPGLRPTPERVRETLFNWLAPGLPGARCLDLFAGSGALGLEAASRGASRVVAVEQDRGAYRGLAENRARLDARQVETVHGEALGWLTGTPEPFDIVFLDPPFGSGLLSRAVTALGVRGWLARGARVYLECEAARHEPPLGPGWELLRSKKAGEVRYHLALTP